LPSAGRRAKILGRIRSVNLSFLFWNLRNRSLVERVASLVAERDVDVVMLAECADAPADLCAELSRRSGKPFHLPFSLATKLVILTRLPASWMSPVFDDPLGHLTVRRLIVEERIDVLLAVVHFQSKERYTDDDQLLAATHLARSIENREDEHGHRRTILVGDLNMNPFEKGVVAAGALHAVMHRKVAAGGGRTIDAREYPFFYNPMWGCFGDRTDGPAGTYYYRKATPVMYFWNIFDQVLLRPEIMHTLQDLQILTHDGDASLLSRGGTPDTTGGSDHLPLYFRLNV
jgi:endonuclease/exonuclease/phosphatase family metal-dependent hydrolase